MLPTLPPRVYARKPKSRTYGYHTLNQRVWKNGTSQEEMVFMLWRDGADLSGPVSMMRKNYEVVVTAMWGKERTGVGEAHFLKALSNCGCREELIAAVHSGGHVDGDSLTLLSQCVDALRGLEQFKGDPYLNYIPPHGDEYTIQVGNGEKAARI